MELDTTQLKDWIARLRRDPEATVTVQPSGLPYDSFKHPAIWRLGVFASAYFYIPEARRIHTGQAIPRLHERFQTLTGHALTAYQPPGSGSVSKKYTADKIKSHFDQRSVDMSLAILNGFDGGTKESSPGFAMEVIAQFGKGMGLNPMLSYLSIRLPLGFWRTQRDAVRQWWFDVLTDLRPEQAYLGLAFANPPILERYPLIETAERALAETFLGLDVDKPMFMRSSARSGMHLECGQRTPSFGVLLAGEALAKLGGKQAVWEQATAHHDLYLRECLDGWWVEAGAEPALYPVEQGVPVPQRALARLTQPLRLETLRMVSYNPNLPDESRFTPAAARRWLKRFDEDGDWPDAKADAPSQPVPAASVTPAPVQTLTAQPGQAVPRGGVWQTTAMLEPRSIKLNAGETLPATLYDKSGNAVVWFLRVE